MKNELIDFLTKLESIENEEDAWSLHNKAALNLGFNIINYGMQLTTVDSPIVYKHTYKNNWRDYYNDKKYYEIDPFYAHFQKSSLPIFFDYEDEKTTVPWSKIDPSLFHDWVDAGAKRAICIPLKSNPLKQGGITFCSDLMSSSEFSHLIENNFSTIYAIAQAAYHEAYAPLFKQSMETRLKISPRQKEILYELAKGMSNKQIAEKLKIKEVTVSFHINELKTKLKCNINREIIPMAHRQGILSDINYDY